MNIFESIITNGQKLNECDDKSKKVIARRRSKKLDEDTTVITDPSIDAEVIIAKDDECPDCNKIIIDVDDNAEEIEVADEVEVLEPADNEAVATNFALLDDDILSEMLTKFITKYYKNAKCMEIKSAKIRNNDLMCEGVITFKSGKQKVVKMKFEGLDRDASKIKSRCSVSENVFGTSSKYPFLLEATIKNKTITPTALRFNLKINESKILRGSVSRKLKENAGEETLITWMPEWQAGESLYPDKTNADRVRAFDKDTGGIISAGLEALGITPADAAIRDHDNAWEFSDVDQEYRSIASRAIKNAWRNGTSIREPDEYTDARISTIKGTKVVIVYNSYDDMYTIIFKDPDPEHTARKHVDNDPVKDNTNDHKERRWTDPKDPKDPKAALKKYYPNGLNTRVLKDDSSRFSEYLRHAVDRNSVEYPSLNYYAFRDLENGIDFIPEVADDGSREVIGLRDIVHFEFE